MGKPEFGFGVHLILDGYGCDPAALQDINLIYNFLDNYPTQMDMTKIMPPYVFRYSGAVPEDWGVSGFVLIAESHISIHTFPEKKFVSIDVYTCKNNMNTDFITKFFKDRFDIQDAEVNFIRRGTRYATIK